MECRLGRLAHDLRTDRPAGFDFVGTYTHVEEPKLIEYSFGDRAARVEFAATPEGTSVRVTFDSETTYSVDQQRSGWQAILDRFKRHVEQQPATR